MLGGARFINSHLGGGLCVGSVQGLLMLLLALTQFGTLSKKDLESDLSNPETSSKQLRVLLVMFSLKHHFKQWIT